MTAKILDGAALAKERREALKKTIARHIETGNSIPGLAVVLVGDDPASKVYVSHKAKACAEVGINLIQHVLPEKTTQKELLNLIHTLNHDNALNGIIVQLPLPTQIDATSILEAITPEKDVDGFHPYNLGRLAQRRPLLRPSTPLGIISMLRHYGIKFQGLNATIVGVSNIVGRPMLLELLLAGSTVTACHRLTKDLASHIRQADLLIVAIGKPGIIRSEWIKPGAIVVDVGITRLEDGRLTGDIEFETAKEIASWITPVPGGVGPMTIVGLLENTFYAATSLPNLLPQ